MFGRNVISLGVAINLRDNFSRQADEAIGKMQKMNLTAMQLSRNSDKMIGTGYKLMGAGAAMLLPLNSALKEYASYGKILRQIQVSGDLSDAEFKRLKDRIEEVGMKSTYTIQEIGAASLELARQGMPFDILTKSIGSINDVAQATGSNLQNTSKFFSSILSIYPQLKNNTDRLSSILVYASNKSRASIEDLANAYNYMGASAKQMNMPIEESMALLMRLADTGLESSKGGVIADNFIRFYAKFMSSNASKKMKGALASMGLSTQDFRDARGELLSTDKALNVFGRAIKRLQEQGKKEEALSAMGILVGERGKRAGITTEDVMTAFKSQSAYMDQLRNIDPNYAAKASAKVTDGIWGDLDRLKDSILLFKVGVIEPLEPILRIVVKGLTNLVNLATAIGKTPLGGFLTGAVALIGTASLVLGGFNFILGNGIKLILSASTGWNNWRLSAVGAIAQAKAQLLQFLLLQQRSAAITQVQSNQLRYSHTSPLGIQYWRDSRGRFARGPQGGVTTPPFFGAMIGGMGANTGRGLMTRGLFSGLSRFLGPMAAGRLVLGGGAIAGTLTGILPAAMGVITALSLLSGAISYFNRDVEESSSEFEREKLARQQIIKSISLNQAWDLDQTQYQKVMSKPTQITINLDGKESFRKIIQQNEADLFYSLPFE